MKNFIVSKILHKINRQRLFKRLADVWPKESFENSCILLKGGFENNRYATDTQFSPFRQESYFQWLFGVTVPSFYGMLLLQEEKSILFTDKKDPSYEVWQGKIKTIEEIKLEHFVDDVYYNEQIKEIINKNNVTKIFILNEKQLPNMFFTKDQVQALTGISNINSESLIADMADLRCIKTKEEIEVLRYVVEKSSNAHKALMRSAKPGLYEYQCESVFLNDLYYNSSMRHVGYTSIVASGLNAAILHYGHAAAPNDRQMKNGELCLADCGGEYYGYTADITVTFPVNGKFDLQQVDIYNLVLSVNRKIFNMANVGVKWVDLHIKSLKLIADGLLKLNLLIGDIDEIYASGVAKLFMPHGLGHQLGLDVHDVNPKVKTDGKFEVLRTHCILAENMIVTIEPGCYFIKSLLDSGYKDSKYKKFLNKKVIDEYVHVGGVRIEDDVLITKSGAEDLVKLPRTVKEIESFLKK